MSIMYPVPKEQLGTVFTNLGLAYGIIPVYVGFPESDYPAISVRNWMPEWPLDLLIWLHDMSTFLGVPDCGVPIRVGKEIKESK